MKKKKKDDNEIIADIDKTRSERIKLLKHKCLYLYNTGKPFFLIKTGNTYQLKSDYFNAKAVGGNFTTQDLHFIKSVKNYVLKNAIGAKLAGVDYNTKDINYIEVKDFAAGEVIKDVVEIDIDHAYWETAYHLGVIDKSIYKKGLKVSKKVRLAALGTLARRTETWVYSNKRMNKLPDIRSRTTENIWFAICKRVSDVMGLALNAVKEDFVFYWVDGMYIRNNINAVAKVMGVFNEWGYEVKSKLIHEIVFTDFGFKVFGVKKDDEREFTYPVKNRKRTIRRYNEDLRIKKLAEEILLNKK
jgi:hypothetical protein